MVILKIIIAGGSYTFVVPGSREGLIYADGMSLMDMALNYLIERASQEGPHKNTFVFHAGVLQRLIELIKRKGIDFDAFLIAGDGK